MMSALENISEKRKRNCTLLPDTFDIEAQYLLNSVRSANDKHLTGRQKLSIALYRTSLLNRSVKQVFIFIVGSSGVGKSSTVNHLFNLTQQGEQKVAFANVNSSTCETRDTTEYFIQTNSESYEVSDLKMGIIDTPGFQDTDGIQQDACNILSIERFFQEHPNLQGAQPNIIFICVAATDTRFQGKNSNFVKSLRCLRKMNLVDQKHPNVVAVITKCCSLQPNYLLEPEEWGKKLSDLRMAIHDIIFNTLYVSAPVVAIENEHKYLERPVKGLKKSHFTRLPNGRLQPYNLFKACVKTLQSNQDLFGEIVFNTCFKHSKPKKVDLGFQIKAKIASNDCLNEKEKEYITFFEELNMGTGDTLTEKVKQFISITAPTVEVKREIEDVAATIRKLGAKTDQDWMQYNSIRVEYNMSVPLGTFGKSFMTDCLGIEKCEGEDFSDTSMLHGYDIFNNEVVTDRDIFIQNCQESQYGLKLPDLVSVHKENSYSKFDGKYSTTEEVVKSRLEHLHIENQDIDLTKFQFQITPGYTSVLREWRTFKLYGSIVNPNTKLTKEFSDSVEKLPNFFEPHNIDQLRCFKNFFETWGQYVIVEAFAGGSVEENGAGTGSKARKLNVKGGQRDIQTEKIFSDKSEFKNWVHSCIWVPALLLTEISLIPISTVVAMADDTKKLSTEQAMSFLLSGALDQQIAFPCDNNFVNQLSDTKQFEDDESISGQTDLLSAYTNDSQHFNVLKDDSEQPNVLKDDSEQPNVHKDDSEQPNVLKDDSEQPNVHKEDSEQPNVHKDDYEQPNVLKDDSEQPNVHKEDSEQPNVHKDDSEQVDVSKEDLEHPVVFEEDSNVPDSPFSGAGLVSSLVRRFSQINSNLSVSREDEINKSNSPLTGERKDQEKVSRVRSMVKSFSLKSEDDEQKLPPRKISCGDDEKSRKRSVSERHKVNPVKEKQKESSIKTKIELTTLESSLGNLEATDKVKSLPEAKSNSENIVNEQTNNQKVADQEQSKRAHMRKEIEQSLTDQSGKIEKSTTRSKLDDLMKEVEQMIIEEHQKKEAVIRKKYERLKEKHLLEEARKQETISAGDLQRLMKAQQKWEEDIKLEEQRIIDEERRLDEERNELKRIMFESRNFLEEDDEPTTREEAVNMLKTKRFSEMLSRVGVGCKRFFAMFLK